MMTDAVPKPIPHPPPYGHAWLGWWYTFWRTVLLLGHRRPRLLEEPVTIPASAPSGVRELTLLLEEYRSAYAAAARTYGANYKGGYWMMYFAAPLAVFCSAATAAEIAAVQVSYGIELALILSILVLFLLMYLGDWQKLWIRSRRTSEHLRYLPLVAPFVKNRDANWYQELAARRGLRIIVDDTVTDVCAWLARTDAPGALQLEDPSFRAGYISYVQELLAQQIHYHTDKAEIERALSRRIGLTSTTFFGITILCTAVLFAMSRGNPHRFPYLRLLATVLPAIGTGLRGLLAQGESHRVAELSEGMAKRLTQLRDQLKALPADTNSTQELENVVWNAVQELLSEADTWMRLQESAPLSPAA